MWSQGRAKRGGHAMGVQRKENSLASWDCEIGIGLEESGRFERGEGMAANRRTSGNVQRQESFGFVYRGQ